MKKLSVLIIALIIGSNISAQNSTKAKNLLDEVSSKIKSYQNVVLDFKYELHNVEENIKDQQSGSIKVQGEKYLLDFIGSTQMYDGKKVHTIIPDNEEVVIEDKSEDDENTMSPTKMLTFYQDGYNYQWDISQNVKGKKIQYIKLTPIDSASEIKQILLGIDMSTKNIYKLIQTGTDQIKTTITVNSFKTNQALSKSLFTFDESKYADYIISRN